MSRWGPGFHVNGNRCEFNEFTPGEVARITGLSASLQRVWRKRGHIVFGDRATARFNSRDVAELFVRYQLSLLGTPPGESEDIGCLAAQIVLWFALLHSDGAAEVTGIPEHVEWFTEEFQRNDTFVHHMTGKPVVKRYLFRPPGGKLVFVDDVRLILNEEAHFALACVDLGAIGFHLAEEARKPLFNIDASPRIGGKRVRRLTSGRPA